MSKLLADLIATFNFSIVILFFKIITALQKTKLSKDGITFSSLRYATEILQLSSIALQSFSVLKDVSLTSI